MPWTKISIASDQPCRDIFSTSALFFGFCHNIVSPRDFSHLIGHHLPAKIAIVCQTDGLLDFVDMRDGQSRLFPFSLLSCIHPLAGLEIVRVCSCKLLLLLLDGIKSVGLLLTSFKCVEFLTERFIAVHQLLEPSVEIKCRIFLKTWELIRIVGLSGGLLLFDQLPQVLKLASQLLIFLSHP